MYHFDLSGQWALRPEFLDVTAERAAEVLRRPEGAFRFGAKHFPSSQGWLKATVPCDVLTPLMEAGFVDEPVEKRNSLNCQWVKDFSWWFKKEFEIDDRLFSCEQVRLYIETLDYDAAIFINGVKVDHHLNAFVPFEKDIKSYLAPGANTLLIRLTNGAEGARPSLDSLSYYNASGDEARRCYLRKPQFSYGWDWCPCVPTCGIGGTVELRGISGAFIRDARLDTISLRQGTADLALNVTLEDVGMTRSGFGTLSLQLFFEETDVFQHSMDVQLVGGLNYLSHAFSIPNPHLWHVNGTGDAALYTLVLDLEYRGEHHRKSLKVGIRTISIDCSAREDGTRNFRFFVNGKPVYCMGGNWVPPDVVYLRVPDETYRTLVDEAADAHFTMLRVWGGGRYEPDVFYERCSERGILVMQDFMYACALYPDWDSSFMYQATLEADYQTRRLSHYACMAVWAGNNEIAESYWGWYDELAKGRYEYGTHIFNYVLPQAVHTNCPLIPYMPSSPFFGEWPKDPSQGDIHLWGLMCTLKQRYQMEDYHSFLPNVTHEIYEEVARQIRFNSEYGFYGSPMPSTIRRYHGDEPVKAGSKILAHHKEPLGPAGMRALCIENLLCPVDRISGDDFFIYSAIAQGIEYHQLARAMRNYEHCSGNLIWMFNDAWPESGFTPIDYYLTRKPSYYYLKRAFSPRKFLISVYQGQAKLILINHAGEDTLVCFEYGFMTYEGAVRWQKSAEIHLPAFSWHMHCTFRADYGEEEGMYYVRTADGDESGFGHDTSLREYWRDTPIPKGTLSFSLCREDEATLVTVTAGSVYLPIVEIQCADDRTKMEDNYFDLLPNMTRTIKVEGIVNNVRALPLYACKRDYDPRDPYDFQKKRLAHTEK